MAAPAVEFPSRRFGKYVVRSRLGEGGMAEVFLAEATPAHGKVVNVALKVMKQGVSDDAFADEADLMGLLSHPNLVAGLEIGHAFDRPYIAMEFLVGGDLRRALHAQQGAPTAAVPPQVAVQIALEVLKGLAYFHQARSRSGLPLALVHGDINPANVFFGRRGEVKLGDFGVAKSHRADIGPRDGLAAGKLHYLSPEQVRGAALTPASDLFSVGVMLHELLLGRPPFGEGSEDPKVVMAAIRGGRLSLPEGMEKPLVQILRRALATEPSSRYRTAGELAGALLHYGLDANLALAPSEIRTWLDRARHRHPR